MATKAPTKPPLKPTPPAAPAAPEDVVDTVPPVEEEDTTPDGAVEPDGEVESPEEDAGEEIDPFAEVPWFGMIAPEGVPTGDGRKFGLGSLTWRDLPLPLLHIPISGDGGHKGAATVGRLDYAVKDDAGRVWGAGVFVPQLPFADEALEMVISGAAKGVSVDTDSIVVQMDEEMDPQKIMAGEQELVFEKARIAGLTMVPIPAFSQAFIQFGDQTDLEAAIAAANGEQTDAPIAASAAFEDCGCELAVTDAPFTFARTDYTDAQWEAATVGITVDQERILPILTPSGELSSAAVQDYVARFAEISEGLATSTVEFTEAALHAALVDLGEETEEVFADVPPTDAPPTPADAKPDAKAPGLKKDGTPPQCKYGPEVATKYVLHSEGMAFIPTCDEHLDQAKADAEKSTPDGTPDPSNIVRVGNYALTASGAQFAPGTHDGPGWITHPRDTQRLRNYWVHGKGAAKIRWGQPGDFNRCRSQLGKYVQPRFLAGTCANLHKEAIKIWPGQEDSRKGNRGHHAAETLVASAMFNFVDERGELPPMRFFENPNLDQITQLVVEDDGHVYGHLAEWGTCHIGIPGACVTPPPSYSNYAYFHTGRVETDGGEVAVGHLTMGIGHASLDPEFSASMATAHYDRDDAVVADVVMGEDAHGIWFSGMLRPGVEDDRVAKFKANGSLSGDWRDVHGSLELIGAVAVNTPGFPIPRTGLAASAAGQTALVAAGIVIDQPKPTEVRQMTAAEIAAISRAAVQEFVAQQEREKRVRALRARTDSLRNGRVAALRSRIRKEA